MRLGMPSIEDGYLDIIELDPNVDRTRHIKIDDIIMVEDIAQYTLIAFKYKEYIKSVIADHTYNVIVDLVEGTHNV